MAEVADGLHEGHGCRYMLQIVDPGLHDRAGELGAGSRERYLLLRRLLPAPGSLLPMS